MIPRNLYLPPYVSLIKPTFPWVPARYTHFSPNFITFGFHIVISKGATWQPIFHCTCTHFSRDLAERLWWTGQGTRSRLIVLCPQGSRCQATDPGKDETRADHDARQLKAGVEDIAASYQRWQSRGKVKGRGDLEGKLVPVETMLEKRPGPIMSARTTAGKYQA